ncbi:hypothetical protein [Cellulomonas cellasea]|uniref:Uncharacterized protein n=1 Tax=Cellulomonas cellasea TaxID=43670 RepID=A0A7W4Y9J8_9CELL|nr:hypothetical protein [Cellulomonas cellasea]MBB2921668.1 hypothetical protein [Cellulomonas cellasea]
MPLPLDAAGGAAGATNPGGVTAAGTAPLSLDATGAVAVAAVSQPDATVPLPYDGASRD